MPGEETRALSNESEDIFVKEFSVACDVKYISQDRSSGFSNTDFNFVLMWIWVLIFSHCVYFFGSSLLNQHRQHRFALEELFT